MFNYFRRTHVMSGLRGGYIRVSSIDQNPERQLEGMTFDKVFTDKASAKIDQVAIIVVVHTSRQGRIRLISARPASRRERRIYYEQIQKTDDF